MIENKLTPLKPPSIFYFSSKIESVDVETKIIDLATNRVFDSIDEALQHLDPNAKVKIVNEISGYCGFRYYGTNPTPLQLDAKLKLKSNQGGTLDEETIFTLMLSPSLYEEFHLEAVKTTTLSAISTTTFKLFLDSTLNQPGCFIPACIEGHSSDKEIFPAPW